MRDGITRLDGRLPDHLAPFHDLLSLTIEDQRYLELEPRKRKERIFEALEDLLIKLSQNQLLILSVEDLHWIDTTSEEFLDCLVGRLDLVRIRNIM